MVETRDNSLEGRFKLLISAESFATDLFEVKEKAPESTDYLQNTLRVSCVNSNSGETLAEYLF